MSDDPQGRETDAAIFEALLAIALAALACAVLWAMAVKAGVL